MNDRGVRTNKLCLSIRIHKNVRMIRANRSCLRQQNTIVQLIGNAGSGSVASEKSLEKSNDESKKESGLH